LILSKANANGPSSPDGSHLDSYMRKWLVVGLVVGVVVVASLGIYLGYNYYQSTNPPWLFKGAYAEYSGSSTAYQCYGIEGCGNVTTVVAVRLQVFGYNSSDVLMEYDYIQTSICKFPSCGAPSLTNATRWVSIAAAPTLTPISLIDTSLGNVSSTSIVLHGTTYDVTAYEYLSGGATFTVYIYPIVGFPIRYSFGPSPLFDIDINQTNIPEL
jgi:hypothetical protein